MTTTKQELYRNVAHVTFQNINNKLDAYIPKGKTFLYGGVGAPSRFTITLNRTDCEEDEKFDRNIDVHSLEHIYLPAEEPYANASLECFAAEVTKFGELFCERLLTQELSKDEAMLFFITQVIVEDKLITIEYVWDYPSTEIDVTGHAAATDDTLKKLKK